MSRRTQPYDAIRVESRLPDPGIWSLSGSLSRGRDAMSAVKSHCIDSFAVEVVRLGITMAEGSATYVRQFSY